jgi:hypothetical protein
MARKDQELRRYPCRRYRKVVRNPSARGSELTREHGHDLEWSGAGQSHGEGTMPPKETTGNLEIRVSFLGDDSPESKKVAERLAEAGIRFDEFQYDPDTQTNGSPWDLRPPSACIYLNENNGRCYEGLEAIEYYVVREVQRLQRKSG